MSRQSNTGTDGTHEGEIKRRMACLERKTEEEFDVKAKNKDKEMDMMISDVEHQKKEVIAIEENEEYQSTGRKRENSTNKGEREWQKEE